MELSERGQRPARIVLIDDDPALGGYLTRVLRRFGSQIGVRDYPDPALITSTARYWSRYCGGSHAEPFEVIRDRAGALPARSSGGHALVTP